jgi:hypothetical protein
MEKFKIIFLRINLGMAPKYTHEYITRTVIADDETEAIQKAWILLRKKYKDADQNYHFAIFMNNSQTKSAH